MSESKPITNPEPWVGKMAYAEANRCLDQQQNSLDELRTRVNTLLSATVVATSFLAAAAARGRGAGFPREFYWAVVPFGVLILACFAILWPRGKWVFSLQPGEILRRADPDSSSDDFQAVLAGELGKSIADNDGRLRLMFYIFGLSVLAALWEIVAWIVIIV